jgi:SAM-dependent methyltransferase
VLDYNREAELYDRTRGGDARAAAAAEAVETLLPDGAAIVVDVACGTGSVTARLRRPDRRVIGVDRAYGMARVAASRVPGAVAVADAAELPLPDASVDAVVMVWLLHLLDMTVSAAAIREACRVLRPGGVLVTTVNKDEAPYARESDVSALITPVRNAYSMPQPDAPVRIAEICAPRGLMVTSCVTFVGRGQGRSPEAWREAIASLPLGWNHRATPDALAALDARLGALPAQSRPRPDPIYTLIALTKSSPH